MDTMNARLRQARITAGFKSARAAALRFAWSISTYAAHENGQNNFDSVTALKYAKAFDTSPSWLVLGSSPPKPTEFMKVVGLVRSSDDVEFIDPKRDHGTIREITSLTTLPTGAAAFEVCGNGLWPRYDNGDLIIAFMDIFAEKYKIDHEEEKIILTRDGKALLKTLSQATGSSKFELRAHNTPPIVDVAMGDIAAVWDIWMIVPRSRWNYLLPEDLSTSPEVIP